VTTSTRSGPSASAVGDSTGIITVQCTSSLISLHVSLPHYTASRRVTHLPAWSAQRHLAWYTPQRGSPHSPQTDTTVHLCTSLVGCYTAAPHSVTHSTHRHTHGTVHSVTVRDAHTRCTASAAGEGQGREAQQHLTRNTHTHTGASLSSSRRHSSSASSSLPLLLHSALSASACHSSAARITCFSLRALLLLARPPARVSTPRFVFRYVRRICFLQDVPYGCPQLGDRLHS
jgi:hypothetical protein